MNISPTSDGPIIFSDFDGTITEIDVTDSILTQFADPAWIKVEQQWVRGEIGSRECLARQMDLVHASVGDLNALIGSVLLDPHFAGFHSWLSKRAIPFYVLSDGFDYVIRRILRRCGVTGPLSNGSHLFASSLRIESGRLSTAFPHPAVVCEHGCATCKAAVMRRLKGAYAPSIFIGDGLSDRFAAAEADLVFAKKRLLEYCRNQRIECVPFETFADIAAAVSKLIGPRQASTRRKREEPFRAEPNIITA